MPDAGAGPAIELVSQTPVATAGAALRHHAAPRRASPPTGASPSRCTSACGRGPSSPCRWRASELRSVLFPLVVPLSDLPAQPDGTRRVVLPIGQAGGLPIPTEGVYPVELTAQDAAGTALTALVTHLIVPPGRRRRGTEPRGGAGGRARRAARAAARRQDPARARRRGGDRVARRRAHGRAGRAGHALGSARDHRRPARVRRAWRPGARRRDAAPPPTGRTVLDEPYVPLDLDALARRRAAQRGRRHSWSEAGRCSPTRSASRPMARCASRPPPWAPTGSGRWPSPAPDGWWSTTSTSSRSPPASSATRSPSPSWWPSPTGPRPTTTRPGDVLALAPDPIVMERLDADDDAGAGREPRAGRAGAAPPRATQRRPGERPPAHPRSAERHRGAAPAGDRRGPPVRGHDAGGRLRPRRARPRRRRQPRGAVARAGAVGGDLRGHRARSSRSAAPSSTRSPASSDRTARCPTCRAGTCSCATAAGLEDAERRAHLDAANAAMDDVPGQVTTPPTFTLTLTAREGTIPLTIRNDSGVPLRGADPPQQPEARVPGRRHDRRELRR